MIYTFFIILIAIILGGGLVYFIFLPIDELVTVMELDFPTVFTGVGWNAVKAIINWRMLLLVIIPTLIWVYVNNQGVEER